MAVHTYGLTVADITAMIGHQENITATTSPSSVTVAEWVIRESAVLNGVLRSVGVVPESLTSGSTGAELELFHQARSAICKRVAAAWIVANRADDTDQAISYRIQVDLWLDRLRADQASVTGRPGPVSFRPVISPADRPWKHGRSYR